MEILRQRCKVSKQKLWFSHLKQIFTSREKVFLVSSTGSVVDVYSRPEDSAYEVQNMKPGIGEVIAFPSIWGHWAGGKSVVDLTIRAAVDNTYRSR